jgi:hypothetical protein
MATPTRIEMGWLLTCQTPGCTGKYKTDCIITSGPNKGALRGARYGLHASRLLAADEAIVRGYVPGFSAGAASRQPEVERLTTTATALLGERDVLSTKYNQLFPLYEQAINRIVALETENLDLHAQIKALTKPEPIPGLRVLAAAMPWMWRGQATFDNIFLNPAGEANKFLARGAQMRDKPTVGPATGEWKAEHYDAWVAAGQRAHLDGFWLDITTPRDGNENYERVKMMAQACAKAGFFGVPMLDCNGGGFKELPNAMTPEAVADMVAKFFAYGVSFFDGAYWVGSFKADGDEKTTFIAGIPAVDYWSRFLKALRAQVDGPVKFTAMLLYPTEKNINSLATVADHIAFWGYANPNNVSKYSNLAALIRAAGAVPDGVAIPQDWRPRESVYAEANNTELYRKTWDQCRKDKVQHVIVRTWDDFAEATQACPTARSGNAWADLTAIEADYFRYGQRPQLVSPWTMVTKRTQLTTSKPSLPNQIPVLCTLDGGGTPRDMVEILVIDNDGEHATLSPLADPGTPKVADRTYVAYAESPSWA